MVCLSQAAQYDVYTKGNIQKGKYIYFMYHYIYSKFSLSYLIFWKILRSFLKYKVCDFKIETNDLCC